MSVQQSNRDLQGAFLEVLGILLEYVGPVSPNPLGFLRRRHDYLLLGCCQNKMGIFLSITDYSDHLSLEINVFSIAALNRGRNGSSWMELIMR